MDLVPFNDHCAVLRFMYNVSHQIILRCQLGIIGIANID